MAKRLERVKVADIFPLEDEYGNQYANRDYSLDVNKAYIAELAESFGASGEPEEAVKLVADGDVWRILAGNSRVMAMKELGTEECWAVIDDDVTAQEALATAIRTDHKKKYEEVEISGYTQQLALLCDDDYVSDVTGLDAEKVKRIRRQTKVLAEMAATMTLDRLLLLDEFDGDQEAYDEILGARDDGKAQAVAADLRKERENAAKVEAFKVAAEAEGLELVELVGGDGRRWICSVGEPEGLHGELEQALADNRDVVGKLSTQSWQGPYVTLYGFSTKEKQEDPEVAERRRKREEAESACENALDAREAWFMEQVRADAPMPSVSAMLRETFLNHKITGDYNAATYDTALNMIADADDGARIDETMNQLCRFIVWWWLPAHRFTPGKAGSIAEGVAGSYSADSAKGYLALGEAMAADGYQPGEADQWVTNLVSEFLAALDEEDDGEGDDDDEWEE